MLTPELLNPTFPPATVGGRVVPVVALTMRGYAHWRAFAKATEANDEEGAQRELLAAAQCAVPAASMEDLLGETPAMLLALVTVAMGRVEDVMAALEAQAGNGSGAPSPASTPTPSVP